MPVNNQAVLKQIDSLLDQYSASRARSQYDDLSDLPHEIQAELLTRMAATIERLAPAKSRYVETLQQEIKSAGATNIYLFTIFVGILRALKADIAEGYLESLAELIHADMFGDLLEMAGYLSEQGYKDPAAVIAGTVVEQHLRNLCTKHGISVEQGGRPKKADTMNSELGGADVYSKLDQKSVTAWMDLRNKAAHGKYSEYTNDQVALLIQSIRDFVSRNPA